ncbi:MAG: methionine adenosyltransferase [Candidatus Krumholzibacteriia bacterium]
MGTGRLLTAEAVTAGHSDKLCDLIADSILDAILAQDRFARVSCEVLVTTGMVVVTGQITTKCYVDIATVVRRTILAVGYDDPTTGFDHQSCAVVVMLEEQSPNVAVGVDRKGAGDQGIVVGYATDEGNVLPGGTALMPAPAYFANRLADRLTAVRRAGRVPYLYPDGKTQVTLACDAQGRPRRAADVVVSAHHRPEASQATIRRDLLKLVVKPVLGPTGLLDDATRIHINPTGSFTHGGPRADCGQTGRKITVDSYGAACPHGGSAFSGKDPTKPDRSGSYGARWVAKQLVAAGLARRCTVEIVYVIGLPEPIVVQVDSFGTGALPDAKLTDLVRARFDLSPAGIIEALDLRRPIYAPTAVGGHFGRDGLPWEELTFVPELRAAAPATRGRKGAA